VVSRLHTRNTWDPFEPWMVFFQLRYPHLQGLRLNLDSLTYPEEVEKLPKGYQPLRPGLFFLTTPDLYYVCDCTDENKGLSEAGGTLKDVYLRMKELRYLRVGDNRWPVERVITTVSQTRYFPQYHRKSVESIIEPDEELIIELDV